MADLKLRPGSFSTPDQPFYDVFVDGDHVGAVFKYANRWQARRLIPISADHAMPVEGPHTMTRKEALNWLSAHVDAQPHQRPTADNAPVVPDADPYEPWSW